MKRIAPVFILLVSVAAVASAAGLTDLGRPELLPIHIIAMGAASAGFLTGGIIAKYFKKNKQWLKFHRRVQWTSSALGLLGVVSGIIMVENTGGNHLRYTHSIVALISILIVAGALSFAFLFLKGRKYKKQFRAIHRWAGRLGILGFLLTVFFGLYAAGIFV